jgi:hypothetical protein
MKFISQIIGSIVFELLLFESSRQSNIKSIAYMALLCGLLDIPFGGFSIF